MLLAIVQEPIARHVAFSGSLATTMLFSLTVAYLLLILAVAGTSGSIDIANQLHWAIDPLEKIHIGLYCFVSRVLAIVIPVTSLPSDVCRPSYLYCGDGKVILDAGLRFFGLLAVLDYLDLKRMKSTV
jgi:hypothetical protein